MSNSNCVLPSRSCHGNGTKQGQRFLAELSTNSASTTDTFIRRFVQGSPKSVALSTLSYLFSPSSFLLLLLPLFSHHSCEYPSPQFSLFCLFGQKGRCKFSKFRSFMQESAKLLGSLETPPLLLTLQCF